MLILVIGARAEAAGDVRIGLPRASTLTFRGSPSAAIAKPAALFAPSADTTALKFTECFLRACGLRFSRTRTINGWGCTVDQPPASLPLTPCLAIVKRATWGATPCLLNGAAEAAAPVVLVKTSEYRGRIALRLSRDGLLQPVNIIDTEDYLAGVVPSEMPPSWPAAALQAQAVAARTYTAANLNKHDGDGFDLCSTTHCQAYSGRPGEDPAADAAVETTAGLILTYDSQPIDALYHASSSGQTLAAAEVWGKSVPYLQAVTVPAEQPYLWERKVAACRAASLVGRVTSSAAAGLTDAVIGSASEHGRVQSMRFTFLSGSVEVRPADFFGLFETVPSRRYGVSLRRRPVPDVFTDADRFRFSTAFPGGVFRGLARLEPSEVVLSGVGYGHGVGMSQWGAQALAAQGRDFREILLTFYQGVKISRLNP